MLAQPVILRTGELSDMHKCINFPYSFLQERAFAAVLAHDEAALRNCALQLAMLQLGRNRYAQDAFDILLAVIAMPEFSAMYGAGSLLTLFGRDADKFTGPQRKRLYKVLAGAYPRFIDRQAQFTITEVVGKNFCDAEALRFLVRLVPISDAEARAFIVHGIEHIVRDGEHALAESAYLTLVSMVDDVADEVRSELRVCLRRIEGAGSDFALRAKETLNNLASG